MKTIAAILLIGVLVRHGAYNGLAAISSYSPAAWFYILGGLWEVALCSIIMMMALEIEGYLRLLISWAMIVGILEGAEIAVCRLPIDNIALVPRGTNLCDYAFNLPVGAAQAGTYLISICSLIGIYWLWKKHEQST